MTVTVLHHIGHPSMATRFIDWMLRTVPTKDDSLQIMYGIRGEKDLTERTLDHFSGYQGSHPVRVGNAAYTQEQHDIFGVVMDVIYQDLAMRQRTPESLDRIWTQVRSIVRTVAATWREPDRGIWEIRGEKRHFVFSKVLCWVAIDRAIKIAELLDKNEWADRRRPLLDEIHDDICKRGWNAEKGAFVQSYGSTDLDASNLLMAEYGFIAPTDPRFVATVERTQEELCVDGLMFRYRNQDDFGKPESAFTVCSFWLVKALASIRATRGSAHTLRIPACVPPTATVSTARISISRRAGILGISRRPTATWRSSTVHWNFRGKRTATSFGCDLSIMANPAGYRVPLIPPRTARCPLPSSSGERGHDR